MKRTGKSTRAKLATAVVLVAASLLMSGCSTIGGALTGAWLGAVFGGNTEAVVSGALVGGAIGTIGQAVEADYRRQSYRTRQWYRDCDCPYCR